MVKTTDDVLDINPLERMERLEEISDAKRRSLANKKREFKELEGRKKVEIEELYDKKRKELEELENRKKIELENLDTKRKELKELEEKKIREIEDTQVLIERSFQELMRHKKIIMQDEEDIKKAAVGNTLEEVANNNIPTIPNQNMGMNYGRFFEELQAPQRFYDITNNSFYNGLTSLRDKAVRGEITSEEELFIERLRNQFEQFNNNESYIEKDQNQYIQRSMNVIGQIGKYQRLKSE